MRGTTGGILQHHQVLRLPRKMTLQHFKEISQTQLKRHFQCGADPSMIRAGSEQETVIRNPPRNRGYFSGPPRAFCIEKYNISRSGDHSKFHRILRLPRKVTLQLHRILRLPRKMTRIIDPHNMSHVIYNAQRNSTHPPTSLNTAPATQNETHDWSAWHMKRYLQCAEQPVASSNITINTAPATQNDCHDWSSSHMKRYLQCAEQQVASSNITKYCACHAKWLSNISKKFLENSWNVISNAGPIRAWSELDPSWIRAGNRHPQPASQPRLLFRTTTSILYWKIQHFALRLSFQISPNTAPATKSDTSTSPNTAPATKSDTWTSPNNAPATKSDTWTSQNSDTNLISYESLLKRIYNLFRISSQTNLISSESLLKRI